MKIGLLGAGAMGSALGARWAALGHELFVGASDVERARALAETLGSPGHFGTYLDAARFGDVLLFGIRWEGVTEVAEALAADPSAVAGTVVIDCTNPVEVDRFTTVTSNVSMSESIQQTLPRARVVKAFNLAHADVWRDEHASVHGARLQVPICGDDATARRLVADLVSEMRLQAIDMGSLEQARNLEGAAAMIIQLLFGGWTTNTVFQFVEATVSTAAPVV